jgi:hypothetical protein
MVVAAHKLVEIGFCVPDETSAVPKARPRIVSFIAAPFVERLRRFHFDRRQRLHPPTQVVGEYQRAPSAFDGAECAGPDSFIQCCAPGACDCARFRNTVSKRGFCHDHLVLLAGMVPATTLASVRERGWLSRARQGKVDQFFTIFGPAAR